MSSFKKATRREIYKFLHVFSMGVLIINMSMLGVFFVGHNVKAVVCQEGDADGDSVCDSYDNCPSVPNLGQEDEDGDGIGDACDLCNDSDGDGYGVGPECLGEDCNDENFNSWQASCLFRDQDEDGYYKENVPDKCQEPAGSMSICYGANIPTGFTETSKGPDCDDTDPNLNETCETGETPNPILEQSCGLDMVLVIDSSSSMYGNPLQQEKDAFLGFVDSFLPETPARIAVVDFNTTATLLQGFTASTTLLENAINSVTTTENTFGSDIKYTNWHDALVKAHAEYSNGRPEAPDLIVFASDGNPNKYNNPAEPTGKDETTALAKAVDEANAVKTDGIRIIALGIGDDVSEDNLTSISGPIVAPPAAVNKDADVILTDFSTLADDLANYATELCGGTVTVKKYVNDVLTGGWDFTAYFNSDTDTGTTDSNGMTNLDIAIDDGSVSVDVEEAVKPDYILDNAFCTINDEPVGTFDNTDSVDNILVSKSDVVYCEFYNIDKPQTGSLTMCKQEDLNGNGLLDSGEPTVTDPLWHFMIEGMDDDFVATTTGCVTVDNLPYGDYNAFEEQAIGWTPTGRIGSSTGNGIFTDHDKISVTIGESNNMPIIYFLNQRTEEPTGSISGCKYRDTSLEEGGLSGKLGGWEITLAQCENNNYNDCDIIATTSTGLIAGEGFGCYEFTGLDAGYYQVREIMQDNWTQTYPVSRYYQTYYNIQLTAGEDMGSKDFANYHEPECNYSISGHKYNPLALMDMPDWTINLKDASGTPIASTTTNSSGYYSFDNLCAGDYVVSEDIPFGWMQTEPIDSSGHNYFEVSLSEESVDASYDFYNKPMICGHKYDSGNNNAPIAGWEINLAQTTGVMCKGDEGDECMSAIAWIASTTTNMDGEYCFEMGGDSQGTYEVSEESRTNWHPDGDTSEIVEFDATAPVFVDFYNYYREPSHGDNHYCGDGVVDSGEGCDDGNNENGDGCNEKCEVEGGPTYFTYTNQGSGATPPSQSTPSVKGEEGAPNLTISKAVAQTTANAGDKNISYKIVVANNGNLTAFDVVVKDTLPEGMTYASDGSTGKTWEIGDLAPGDSKDIMYLANIGEDVDPVVLTNTATVSASNFGEVSDSAEVTVKEIKVLAETGFSLSEFVLLLLALSASFGSAFYLRKKYLKA